MIPMDIQKKLLRVLESNEFRPVGAENVMKVNIRLVAATNRNLIMMIKKDKFREDLYYRLNVFSIDIPPLRERPEDIPILANHFLRQICQTFDKRIKGFSKDAMEIMIKYPWPGNVRELRNAIERLVLIADEDLLSSEKINDIIDIDKESITTNNKYPASLNNIELKKKRKEARESAIRELEEKFVMDALARNNWNVTKAAEDTGMQRTNFQALMKKYNINIRDYTKESDIKE